MISAAGDHEEHAAQHQRLHPPVRRIAVWGPLIGVLILALALIYGIWRHVQLQKEEEEFAKRTSVVAVEYVEVHRNTKAQELILPGNISAVHQATLYARATGYISRWFVDIGDNVKEGQLLAEIAAPDLDQELAQAQEQLRQSKATYEIAKVTAERWQQLLDKKVVSKQENDQTQANYRAADSTMQANQANVDRLVALEDFEKVVAPFTGRITSRLIDIGTLVSAGSGTAGTPLYTIAQTNPLDIYVNVPQSNVPYIHVGLGVELLVTEYPNRHFKGNVIRTAGALDPASRTLNTEIEIPNDDGALYAGMYAQVKFTLNEDHSPIIIPANAFVFKVGGSQVATLTPDHKIHWQKIEIGRDFGSEMEVLSGLEEGAMVVVNPTDDLTEGLAVQARPANQGKPTPAKGNTESSPVENSHPSE